MIRWLSETVAYIDRPNPELEKQLDAAWERIPGLLQWRTPSQGLGSKILAFAATVTSGFASDAEVARRLGLCMTCPARVTDKQGNSYCSGCGCGKWMLAKLDGPVPKLKWADLKCPLKKF